MAGKNIHTQVQYAQHKAFTATPWIIWTSSSTNVHKKRPEAESPHDRRLTLTIYVFLFLSIAGKRALVKHAEQKYVKGIVHVKAQNLVLC